MLINTWNSPHPEKLDFCMGWVQQSQFRSLCDSLLRALAEARWKQHQVSSALRYGSHCSFTQTSEAQQIVLFLHEDVNGPNACCKRIVSALLFIYSYPQKTQDFMFTSVSTAFNTVILIFDHDYYYFYYYYYYLIIISYHIQVVSHCLPVAKNSKSPRQINNWLMHQTMMSQQNPV